MNNNIAEVKMEEGAAAAAAPPPPPPTELDLVVSFDMTGSMSGLLYQVRTELARLADTVFLESALRGISVRMAVIAQEDYGPRGLDDAVRVCAFSADPGTVTAFIQNTKPLGEQAREVGEAYEQALFAARTQLAWRPGAQKVVVLVGDDVPHSPGCAQNVGHVDWRAEAAALAAADIRIFAVHCLTCWPVHYASDFYSTLGGAHAGGAHLMLANCASIVDLLVAMFYHATEERPLLEGLERELEAAGRYNRGLEMAFNQMLRRPDAGRTAYAAAAAARPAAAAAAAHAVPGPARVPVAPGRFQRLAVPADTTIKAFVEATGARFKAGGGFYELTKPEDVSAKKQVVIEHMASGEMFTGGDARTMLGLPPTADGRAGARSVPAGHRAFVQSTSYTRKLIGGTHFLWEMDPNA